MIDVYGVLHTFSVIASHKALINDVDNEVTTLPVRPLLYATSEDLVVWALVVVLQPSVCPYLLPSEAT